MATNYMTANNTATQREKLPNADVITTLAGEIFTDKTMTRAEFKSFVSNSVGGRKFRASAVFVAPYCQVEYLNSPEGLILLAHQDTVAGQVDGIHPVTIGKSISSERNIVEPLKGSQCAASAYNVHNMTRRSQGALVLEAFGRMVHGGDDEAHSVSSDKNFRRLEIYNTNFGPFIGAIENKDRVCVIHPNLMQDESLGYEVAA